jgi:hypothetical protein
MFGKGQLLERWKFHFFKAGSERKVRNSCVVSGYSREVDRICVLLGYYAAYCGNALLTFHNNITVPPSKAKKKKKMSKTFGFEITEYRADRLSRNVGKE